MKNPKLRILTYLLAAAGLLLAAVIPCRYLSTPPAGDPHPLGPGRNRHLQRQAYDLSHLRHGSSSGSAF